MGNNGLVSIFSQIINMSITAGIIIGMVLGIRLCLRRAPKIFSYLLWSVVLFRLLCPVAAESRFSVFGMWEAPAVQKESSAYAPQNTWKPNTVQSAKINDFNPGSIEAPGLEVENQEAAAAAAGKADLEAALIWVGGIIWLLGIACMAGYGFYSTLRLKKRLAGAVRARDNIYISGCIDTPFAMGILAPKIYLPEFLSEKEEGYIILHEQMHIRRGDLVVKLMAFAALAIHWFNPLVWIAFFAAEKDMEMSCDEMVMKRMKEDIRAEYSTSLLCLATGKAMIGGTPLAFGEGNTKSRVKNVMHYKKPAAFAICIAAILVISCLVGFGTNPDGRKRTPADTQQAAAKSQTEDSSVREAAEAWAKAYCGRDGNTIALMSTQKVQDSLEKAGLLDTADGAYAFGTQSPWPGSVEDFRIAEITGMQAEILYYAQTSEPRICVWRETLEFVQQQDTYMVEKEQLEILDEIQSGEEFRRAYPNGLYQTPMDYVWSGTEALLRQYTLFSSNMNFQDLSDPEAAAVYLLNIKKDAVTTNAGNVQEDGSILVDLAFADGFAATVQMVQAFSVPEDTADVVKDGMTVWVPQDYSANGTGSVSSGSDETAESPEAVTENLLYTEYEFLGNYGSERVWIDGTDAEGNGEQVIYSTTADITHDGIKDRIDLLIDTEDPAQSPLAYMQGMGMAYIKAYEGKADGSFGEEAFYVSGEVAHSHAGNGQIGLANKDGKDYLLIGSMYEGQGSTEYRFAVFYLDTEQETAVCADEGLVEFKVWDAAEVSVRAESLGKDEVVDFRRRLESWTKDAVLLVSCDIFADPEICFSVTGAEYRAEEYYDSVWNRE